MAILVPIPSGGTRRVEGQAVTLTAGNVELEPTYVQTVSTNLNTNSNTITDQCGKTEVRTNGDTNWNVDIQGIIRASNLTDLQVLGQFDSGIRVEAEVLGSQGGTYAVESLEITHDDELNSLEVPSGTEIDAAEENAYSFQLQLKAPE